MKVVGSAVSGLVGIASFGGLTGAIWMIVSLFQSHGVGAGIIGIVLIPIAALVFPLYFGFTAGIWWPTLWYVAVAASLAGAKVIENRSLRDGA